MILNHLLLAIFIALQYGDGWSTYLCITSNKGHEANKIVEWGMGKIGLIPALIAYKLFCSILGVFLINYPIGLIILNLFYGYVVYNNYKIFKG